MSQNTTQMVAGKISGQQKFANRIPHPPRNAMPVRKSSARPPGHGGKRQVLRPRHK